MTTNNVYCIYPKALIAEIVLPLLSIAAIMIKNVHLL